MPFDTLEIRISLQKLLIGLTLVIVPLSFVGLYLASHAGASFEARVWLLFNLLTIGYLTLPYSRATEVWMVFKHCSWGGQGSGVCLWRQNGASGLLSSFSQEIDESSAERIRHDRVYGRASGSCR
jgi:hypothetical protein